MPTITITFDIDRMELDLLKRGRCDKPNGTRIKLMLLREAYRNVRYEDERIMQAAQDNAARPIKGRVLTGSEAKLAKQAVEGAHITVREAEQRFAAIGRLRAAVNKSYQEGRRTAQERDYKLAQLDKQDAETKRLLRPNPFVLKRSTRKTKPNHSDHSSLPTRSVD